MKPSLLCLFTRTPLHVGAGNSVGAIDQPVMRERHTGFPIIPGSSIKGVLADLWVEDTYKNDNGKITRNLDKEITWLFGSDDPNEGNASAGALSIGEAHLLAFPIRSARGSFAWITSPMLLSRAARDGVPGIQSIPSDKLDPWLANSSDSSALFKTDAPITLPISNAAPKPRIVLEDYTFNQADEFDSSLSSALMNLLPGEPVLEDLGQRLVIVSDGMMSHFAQTACEVAQHVRINDATGTAEDSGLFNQENVPSETLFYANVNATNGRSEKHRNKIPDNAIEALTKRIQINNNVLQIGADATTGLGFCTASLVNTSLESAVE